MAAGGAGGGERGRAGGAIVMAAGGTGGGGRGRGLSAGDGESGPPRAPGGAPPARP